MINLIQPNSGDKVLEIGCGWGGFAEYLGKNYDVKLDCITISKKQYEFAKERIYNCGLNEKVNIEINMDKDGSAAVSADSEGNADPTKTKEFARKVKEVVVNVIAEEKRVSGSLFTRRK